MPHKTPTPEIEANAIEDYKNGKSISAISLEYRIGKKKVKLAITKYLCSRAGAGLTVKAKQEQFTYSNVQYNNFITKLL